jgi:tetratricopeptide (TPR) repeat protein
MEAIGPYRILDGPFRGGFGEVFKVFDGNSGDEFALKTLRGSFLPGSDALLRFRQEIKVWIDLPGHPHVVRAIKAFEHGGRPYVVIEWVASGDLRAYLATQPSSISLLETMRHVAAGMAHIHRQGLVHGDLKPANVLMWGGQCAQITDFGFARASGEQELRAVGGTEHYLAPEARDGLARVSIDVYAAGVTLREMLDSVAEGDFGVREALALASTMTEPDPDARPLSFDDVHERLSRLLETAPRRSLILMRSGDRRTWEEQHIHAIPEFAALDQAQSLLVAGRRAEAREKLESAVAAKPNWLRARVLLAHCLCEDGDRDACFEQALRARSLAGSDPESLAQVGLIMASIGRLREAEEIRDQLPDGPLRWHVSAATAQIKGDLSDALVWFEKAIASGGMRDIRLGFAEALREAGLIERAIAELEAIGREHAEFGVKAALQLARIYVDIGRYDDATNELRECLRADHGPELRAYMYGELGYLYRRQELFDAAIASYQKALELVPNDRTMLEGLALARRDGSPVARPTDELDARTIYTMLATLEKRFEGDRFEDVLEGVQRVGWSVMLDHCVIPRMRETGRISADEADVLSRARVRSRVEPERDGAGVPIFASVYELLLTLRSAFEMFDPRAFRAHRDHGFRLVPSLYRGARAELPARIERTLAFVRRLASFERFGALVEAGDTDAMLGLVALAQQCGMPSALIEFTSDMRVALSLATIDGRLGQIGELLVLDPAQHPKFVGIDNPYGVFIAAPPTPISQRMKGTFLEGMTPSVLLDPDTTFLERYRFRHDGKPFPAAGGYAADDLLKPVRDLASEVKNAAGEPAAPPAFLGNLRSYFDYLAETEPEIDDHVSMVSYERSCRSLLNAKLDDESQSADRKVANVYVRFQLELRKRGIGPRYTGHAIRPRQAMVEYLQTRGTLEQRLNAGFETWLRSCTDDRKLVMKIAYQALAEYFEVTEE